MVVDRGWDGERGGRSCIEARIEIIAGECAGQVPGAATCVARCGLKFRDRRFAQRR